MLSGADRAYAIRSRVQQHLTSHWMLYSLIALTMPARVLWMHLSLWLDEAWVANAVLAASTKEMIYYPHWVQSTPVLFLLIERSGVLLAGTSEVALRLVPWIGSFAAALVFCDTLQRLFPMPLAMILTVLFSANYWAIKYGQQLKQYGTDLFVSAMLVWLIASLVTAPPSLHRWRWTVILCSVFCFFSLPTIFWVPGLVVALALSRFDPMIPGRAVFLSSRFLKIAALAASILLGAGVSNYVAFVAPNHPDILAKYWDESYHAFLGSGPLLVTVPEFVRTLGNLLIPRSAVNAWLWPAILLLVLTLGVLRSLSGSIEGQVKAVIAMLAGALPLGIAILASFARRYPLLDYPRLILWMLPPVYLLLAYAVEPAVEFCISKPLWKRHANQFSTVLFLSCAAFVLGTSLLFARRQMPSEANRDLFATVEASFRPGDALFVHGGLSEQFEYYRHQLRWNPGPVYIGTTDWPCCVPGRQALTVTPSPTALSQDLAVALRTFHPNTFWIALPSGSSDAWSGMLQPALKAVPATLTAMDCRWLKRREYGQVLLISARCGDGTVSSGATINP